MHPHARSFAAAATLAGFLALSAAAQPAGKPETQPTPTAPPTPAPQDDKKPSAQAPQVPPALMLGLRVDQVRRRLAVAPVVVVVPDVTSYAEAVGMWRLNLRFPVLIDDGTSQAREAIGRFVRAMKPEKVLRWQAKGVKQLYPQATDSTVVENAVGKTWTLDGKTPEKGFDTAALLAQWKALQLASPGIVVTAKDDPAWPAALALAAGHGQPIMWSSSNRKLDNPQTVAEADAFCKSIETFCDSTGLPWHGQGDAIEAVTICMGMPQTIKGTHAGLMALTDRVGRLHAGPSDTQRWAWAGQIPATFTQAAYRAMCSLFLPAGREAWLFDGYVDGPGWNDYDARPADEILRKSGWTTTIVPKPDGTLAAWRAQAAKPFNANLVLVNTQGEKERFHLVSGTGQLADLPILNKPAVVHFIHSFSAQVVGTRDSLSGRWLDRGAAGYIGSVDEPYLNGFMRTGLIAARLVAQMPLGAAGRYDSAPAWKITVLGDPLMTFGGVGPAAPIPKFEGATDLSEEVKATVRTDLAQAMWQLVMLGRDEDAAKLTIAMTKAGGDMFKPDAALPGALALFRTGKADELRELAARLAPADLVKHPEVADAISLVK